MTDELWIVKYVYSDGHTWGCSGTYGITYKNFYKWLNTCKLWNQYTDMPHHRFNFINAIDEEYMINNYNINISIYTENEGSFINLEE